MFNTAAGRLAKRLLDLAPQDLKALWQTKAQNTETILLTPSQELVGELENVVKTMRTSISNSFDDPFWKRYIEEQYTQTLETLISKLSTDEQLDDGHKELLTWRINSVPDVMLPEARQAAQLFDKHREFCQLMAPIIEKHNIQPNSASNENFQVSGNAQSVKFAV